MSVFILFLLVLSVLVLIHEAGHFFAARIFKVKADEFGYGFPPRAFGFVKVDGKWKFVGRKDEKEYKNTIWSVNWLPLGGFVRIKGESPEDSPNDPDSFQSVAIWKRIIILAAGVTMNWFLAFVLFASIFMIGAPAILEDLPEGAVIEDRRINITHMLEGQPAEQAGLLAGDEVLSIAGVEPTDYENAVALIGAQGENEFEMKVARGEEELSLTLQPRYIEEIDKAGIGVAMANVGVVKFTWYQAIYQAGVATYTYTKMIIIAFGGIIKDLVTLKGVSDDVSGPVGIAVLTGQFAKQGIVPLLQFAAILSINLAVINFLPIPALDGGRVVFLLIEKVRRKALRPKLEAMIHQIAFLSLIILILLVTLRDIGKYGGAILGGIKNFIGI
ncbi:MAG: M50 family metallopeptidase [Patescibacteria group bacterium]|nr:M50 family metallopeptidase [Patescibacteria group bacterium]